MRTSRTLPLLLPVVVLAILAFAAAPALAVEGGPQWTLSSVARPTNLAPGAKTGEDYYQVLLTNSGGAASNGSPVTITDELPRGLTLDPVGASGTNPFAELVSPTANFKCALRACTYTAVVVPRRNH